MVATSKARRGEESDRGEETREIVENNAQRDKINSLVEELEAVHEQIAQQTAEHLEEDLLLSRQDGDAPEEQGPAEPPA